MIEKHFSKTIMTVALTAAVLGSQAMTAWSAEPVTVATDMTPPAQKENFHLYLLMGQSNMAGRDTRILAPQVANPHILALDGEGKWIVAKDPLHPNHGSTKSGVGPGMTFAQEMLKANLNVTIGLVPCAVGGTELRRWVKGADLYTKAVSRAKMAAQAGVIEGVLWHQGESDTREQKNAESYEARLTKMFGDLRQELDSPNLPIVVGQLGGFLEKEKFPYADTVRAAIQHIPAVVPQVGYADSMGLGDKGDKLHFSSEAQREFGARYSKAMQALKLPATVASTPVTAVQPLPNSQNVSVELWPETKMPGVGAALPEAEKPSTDGFHRVTNVSRPTLTLFLAPGKGASAPAMIVSPGGGYQHEVMDKEGSEIAQWLNTLGISALLLKYRVPNNREGALQDIQRALSLTRARAGEWNIDHKRLGVIGFSAGGHLSAKASNLFDQRSYVAIDDVDRQSCRPDYAVLVYPAYLGDEKNGLSSELNLKANIPPTLIVHNEDDEKYVVGSKLYNAALDAAKVPHQFSLYQTGGHGYGLRCKGEARAWPLAAAEWLHSIGVR